MQAVSKHIFLRSTLLLTALAFATHCTTTPSQTEVATTEAVVDQENHSKPETTVQALLVWLENHPDQADERSCFELDGVDAVAIDTLCLNTHIATLKNTELFSQEYLDNLREEFATMASELKSEGYTATKDYDRYFNSQDPLSTATVIKQLEKSEILLLGDNVATVRLVFDTNYSLTYHLVKEATIWKVTSIE